MRKSPYQDRLGEDVYELDTIQHPDGRTAVVIFDASYKYTIRWRAVYKDGVSLWLGNQLAGGQAIAMINERIEQQRALEAIVNRRVEVEAILLDVAAGKHPPLTQEQCQILALRLGTPKEYWSEKIKNF